MLVAQITDLHVAPEGSFMRQFVDSNELLARAVAYLNTMTPRPDVVLATGDLTDHGTAEEYALLREILGAARGAAVPRARQPRRAPTCCAPSYGTPEYARDSFDYVVDDFPVRLIALDSTVVGRHDGEIDGAQLASDRRDASPPRPTGRP